MSSNIYATCVSFNSKGILLLGASGSGKSDIALRLIFSHNCTLIADDRVDLLQANGQILASPPQSLQGLLEVRGLGIVNYPFIASIPVKVVVQLTSEVIERMPKPEFWDFENIKIPLFKLNPSEVSCCEKILTALRLSCDDLKNGG